MASFFSLRATELVAQSLPGGSAFAPLMPLVLIFGVFYIFLILPQQRRQKKVQHMLSELKEGDKVLTNGGIYGTIVGVEGDTVQLRIADQVRIKISRQAIASMQPEPKES
jgi:preprotein translocase subunit YajC